MSVGLRELETEWTISDVLDGNLVLDALDDAQAQAEEEAAKRK